MTTFSEGQKAWRTDLPLEYFEEQDLVTDEFLDGWFHAKHSDPDWIEENQLIEEEPDA